MPSLASGQALGLASGLIFKGIVKVAGHIPLTSTPSLTLAMILSLTLALTLARTVTLTPTR